MSVGATKPDDTDSGTPSRVPGRASTGQASARDVEGASSGPAHEAIELSLISHTNAGKTSLARTLLGRDVGEVRDAPHVTMLAERFTLVATPQGGALILWDTPGFGDSARLARRLRQQGNPIGWFLSQIWDRWRDRAFWSSQQAVRNVRESADVVLYLVNASESPEDAGYLAPELEVLAWIGKPTIALLNQTGPPRARTEEHALETRWRDALAPHGFVRDVLTLDAFARCWVQEAVLLAAVGAVLPASRQALFTDLAAAWRTQHLAQFDTAMALLAVPIAKAAQDRATVATPGVADTLRSLPQRLGVGAGQGKADPAQARAAAGMATRLAASLRESTDALITLHGLEGRAAQEVARRLEGAVARTQGLDEGRAAAWGGVVTGALSGLAADLAAGGLTLGIGMLAGGVLGALGGGALARGVNRARGTEGTELTWSDAVLDELVQTAVLRYLAVAHHGRGRGPWAEADIPVHWTRAVSRATTEQGPALAVAWSKRHPGSAPAEIERELVPVLAAATRSVLRELYPEAARAAAV